MRTKNFHFEYIFIVACFAALFDEAHSLEAPQVNIPDHGIIIGTYLKMFRTQNIKAYLGIQYADASRFSPPEMHRLNNGIFNATNLPPDCWQTPKNLLNKQSAIIHRLLLGENQRKYGINKFDENCLHLNIFIPAGSPGVNGYAVIIWIHAGDFSYGSSSDIDPFQLVLKQKVIVVTVSYRLNIFGFLSTGDGEAPGNYGLMDQSAAFIWIRKYIHYFGGNENQVTLMGHSAGAVSVGLHLTSKEWSKNTFAKAIIMSGNPLAGDIVKVPQYYDEVLDAIATIFGCIRRPTVQLVHCLRRVDAKILSENIPLANWGPVIDYGFSNSSLPFIEDFPLTLYQKGYFEKIPILIGITDMEDILSLAEDFSNINFAEEELNKFVREIVLSDVKGHLINEPICFNERIVSDAFVYMYQSDSNHQKLPLNVLINILTDRMYVAPLYSLANILSKYENVFVYNFNVRPKTPFYELPDWIQVPKYFDQIYVWGIPYISNSEFIKEWEPVDKKISDIVMTLWANFVKSSNPTISNIYIKWIPYNFENKSLLVINDNFKLISYRGDNRIRFWNYYYPKLLSFAVECCNSTNSSKSYYISLNQFQYILVTYICSLFTFMLLLTALRKFPLRKQ